MPRNVRIVSKGGEHGESHSHNDKVWDTPLPQEWQMLHLTQMTAVV